jgi:hypothetical protein
MTQASADKYPYPMNDIAMTLPSGTVVRVRNIGVTSVGGDNELEQKANEGPVTIYIETPTPSSQPERLAKEAEELLGLLERLPPVKNGTIANVGICRTQLCLEMRAIPEEMFTFARVPHGIWKLKERAKSE